MTATPASTGRSCRARQLLKTLVFLPLFALIVMLSGCGSGTTRTQTTTTTTPAPQSSNPSTPPVRINWSPSSSPLPAPRAQEPPPSASDDFPLTISSPTDGATLTSPVTVVNLPLPRIQSFSCASTSTNSPFISRLQIPLMRSYSLRPALIRWK